MALMNSSARRFFLEGMRFTFGLWLLYVGATKWFIIGPENFVGMIVTAFDKTWSPHLLNSVLAWVILIAEPVVAIFILTGRSQRIAWSCAAALMFLLTLGQTILMKPDVSANWIYLVLTLICAAQHEPQG